MAKDKKGFRTKAFVSFVILWSFIILVSSGVVLYISPSGSIAKSISWKILSFSRDTWRGMHIIFCFLFVVFILLHVYFNWRELLGYLRNKISRGIHCKRELVFSLIIVGIVLIFALARWQPLSKLLEWRDLIKYKQRTQQSSFLEKKENDPILTIRIEEGKGEISHQSKLKRPKKMAGTAHNSSGISKESTGFQAR